MKDNLKEKDKNHVHKYKLAGCEPAVIGKTYCVVYLYCECGKVVGKVSKPEN